MDMERTNEELNEWFDKKTNDIAALKKTKAIKLIADDGQSITISNTDFVSLKIDYEDDTQNGCKIKGSFFINELRLAINDWGFMPESGVPIVL